jgi:hypothetical protein
VLPDGSEYALTSTNGVHVESVQGVGMPPLHNILTPYAVADGSFYQRTRALSRTITFVLTILAGGEDCYRALKAALMAAVSHHRGVLPFQLKYYGLSHVVYTNVLYDAGLEGGDLAGNAWGAEKVAVRFIAADPYWYDAATDEETTLEGMSLLTGVGYVALRAPDGQWSNLGGGVNDTVYDVLFDTAGNLYLCGEFTAMTSLWEPFDGLAVRAPFATAVAGGGTAAVLGGECQLNTSLAVADAAMIYYNAALSANMIFQTRTRFRAPTITAGGASVARLSNKAVAPVVDTPGDTTIYVVQYPDATIGIGYVDNTLTSRFWNGGTNVWQAAGVAAYAGVIGTTYRVDIVSNGTSWYVVLYDANDTVLETTTPVTWALTRAIANSLWYWAGDAYTVADQANMYIDYVRLEDAAIPTNHIAAWNATEQAFQTLGAGVDDDCYCMTWAPDGTLYVGGDFLNAGGAGAVRVARWNPTTFAWSALGTGCDDIVWDMVFGVDGNLYAVGEFANAGGGAVNYVAYWDGAAWNAMGGGFDQPAFDIERGLDGTLYIAGWFETDSGVTITLNFIARWTGAAWQALDTGADGAGPCNCVAIGKDGTVYVSGNFTSMSGIAAAYVAKWNGVSWAAMGDGLSAGALPSCSAVDLDGVLYMGGTFTASGTYPIPQKWAFWRDPLWIAGDGDMGASTIDSIAIDTDGTMAIGGTFYGSMSYPYWKTVTNSGDANALPVFTVYGPGQLCQIVNYTTGQRLDFNIDMLAGEILTIDLRQGYKTITSNFRGNVTWAEIGHAMAMFYLAPGANYIAFWVNDNIVLNPGFETAGAGGADVFANWTETAGAGAIASSATSYTGVDAAQLTKGGVVGVHDTYIDQTFNVLPGQLYALELMSRSNGTGSGAYSIWDVTNGVWILDITFLDLGLTAVYANTRHTFTIPAGCMQMRLRLYSPVTPLASYHLFDDVHLWRRDHELASVPRYLGIDKAHD